MEQDDEGQDYALKRELITKVSLAASVAKAVPEFGDRAFDKVLDYLLGQGSQLTRRPRTPRKNLGDSRASRRAPTADIDALARIKPILDAPPELVAKYSELLDLDARARIYAVLAIAREEFGIDGLTIPEFRIVARDKFRLGIPDGTLRGTLSKAPATEVGRTSGPNGETTYKLLQPGEVYLRVARSKLPKNRSADVIE